MRMRAHAQKLPCMQVLLPSSQMVRPVSYDVEHTHARALVVAVWKCHGMEVALETERMRASAAPRSVLRSPDKRQWPEQHVSSGRQLHST